MATAMVLMGAYGRQANLEDWRDGKDFKIANGGPYCSIRDLKRMQSDGYDTVILLNASAPAISIDIQKELDRE